VTTQRALASLALSEDERRRAHGVGELAAKGEVAVDALVSMLDDPSWGVRRAVVAALAGLGDVAVTRLCAVLTLHRDSEARVAAAVDALVAAKGDVDGPVLALAESTRPAVVCDAVQVLGRRRSTAAVAKLASLMTVADDNVALAAIEALGRIGDDAAMTPLIAALQSRSFFRAFPAIDVLGRAGNARAVKPLLAALGEPHYAIEAARALGRIGDPSALPGLSALLVAPSDSMVCTGAIAIGEILDGREARFGAVTPPAPALSGDGARPAIHRIMQCLPRADPSEQVALVRAVTWIGGEIAAEALVSALSGDRSAATVAIAALGRLGRVAEPHLLQALARGDSERRLLLLPLLSHRTEGAGPIADCLADPNPSVRALACDALARIGETRFVPRLFELLGDADPRVTQSAVAAIQSLAGAETERLALEAARAPDTRVRRAALRVVAYFGYPSATELLIEAMSDPDERVRHAAIFGLPYVDDPRAIDALLGAVVNASARIRAAGMRALGHAASQPRTLTALRAGLHDHDPWVRYFACQALSRLKDVASADVIAPLLSDPAGQVRVAVVESLAQLRGARALDALHAAATSADADVRRAALLGLGHVKAPASLPVLRQAVASEDSATRLVALSALAEYDGPEVARDLGAAVSDADENVRGAAVALLAARPGQEATRALVEQLSNRPMQSAVVAALAQPAAGRVEVLAEALRCATGEAAQLLVSALVRAHRTEASLVLEEAFSTQDPALRRELAIALAAMSTSRSRSLLAHAALEDPDEQVREISAAAVER
jgi:HEAT repeat protein